MRGNDIAAVDRSCQQPQTVTFVAIGATGETLMKVVLLEFVESPDGDFDTRHIRARRYLKTDDRRFRFSNQGFTKPKRHPVTQSINTHGIGQSINALSPLNVSLGVGINFLARDVLNAASLDDAAARACAATAASGQNLNLGSVH